MKKAVQIIGVPIDLGQSHRGVDLGPGALRYAGLAARLEKLGYEVHDSGNLKVPVRESLSHERQINYLPSIREICEEACAAAQQAVAKGHIPIFLGGDHSISVGTISGVTQEEPAGVLWIDAHGDFNTIGNVTRRAISMAWPWLYCSAMVTRILSMSVDPALASCPKMSS